MKRSAVCLTCVVILLLPFNANAQLIPVKDKVAVLITSWGSPAGYNFEYAWNSHAACRIGDRTLYPGQPCKIGHVGEFPYQSHLGLLPWGLTCIWPGGEKTYDVSGIYQRVKGVYVSVHPDMPSLTSDMIPDNVPITPAVELINPMTGGLYFPPDPRTGENYLADWYQIGLRDSPYPNGLGDLYEKGPLGFMHRFGILGGPSEPPEAYLEGSYALEIFDYTMQMLEESFRGTVDVRYGVYNEITGYTEHEMDVAEDFANEGFRKMLLARETTDNNSYANEFMTGNYVKERLCEIGVLDDMEINQTRQVGRTPEFNAMNVMNLKRFIETYPEGSTIALIYVTRGLPWGVKDSSWLMGTQHPWYKEVFHENAYLNYLSWKKAIQSAYGDRYDLVFTKGGIESDLLEDHLFTYGNYVGEKLGGHFHGLRDTIQSVKQDGVDKIIVAPCHWLYDSMDNLYIIRDLNGIPLLSKADMLAGRFDLTYCEDAEGNEVACGTAEAVSEITIAPSYSHLTQEFAVGYYVVLRGTLERFGLYPHNVWIWTDASKPVTKLDGGTIEVTQPLSLVKGARIEIPADPYPLRPEGFTYETAIPPSDPNDTNDCLWEDTLITIGCQLNPPPMKSALPVGPAVHFGPYRNFFNRDVTITLPYNWAVVNPEKVRAYIYNHLTNDWDAIEPENVDQGSKLVTFKTQVLGLFRVGIES